MTVKHFKVEGGDQYEEIDPADYSITTQNLPASVPAGSTISTTRSSDTITISITPSGSGTPDTYSFTDASGWLTANGCYISTTNNNGLLDIGMGDEGDISSYTVNEDIYLGIYWRVN